ncbi:MAG: DUF305 domain-containing protein [Pseudomonadota bacterium]
MNKSPLFGNSLRTVAVAVSAFSLSLAACAQDVPIVQPGAPGQSSRLLNADEAIAIAETSFSEYDVRFMQDMIPHHFQAVQMSALVKERTNSRELIDIAGRIDAAQADEIAFMKQWLQSRGFDAPDPADHHAMHMSHTMAGMASPEQMKALAASEGVAFDRLFLELMIPHHEGAIAMVDGLLGKPGSAYEPTLYQFANDITNSQSAEIERMNTLLAGLSEDPRASLGAGFSDAGEAILNLEKVITLPKPAGFFDADNPAGLRPAYLSEEEAGDKPTVRPAEFRRSEGTEWDERSPLLSFSNTDMAFDRDLMIVGNYHGFNAYKLDKEGIPALLSSVVCPGGQGDVSIVGELLIMSVEQQRGRIDCGLQGISEDVSEERFRGIRIFNIADPRQPKQVGLVQTCRGSHTHSVVSQGEEDGKIIVYNSGISSVRDGEELEGCVGDEPGDERTALFRIDVIEIPIDDPAKSRVIDSPAVFADPETGRLAGLWQGGDHGEGTQESDPTDQCHDITVFPEENIAAGACSGNGIIFDISDPRKPARIDAVVDQGFAYWHSATFNNDATKVLFTDEWGEGSRPRCRTFDSQEWGANAIYDLDDGKLTFQGYYKLPVPQVAQENCVAHNGSVVPVPGRDIFAQAWYQGGLSISDFTDSANPVEIAYFDRGPIDAEQLILGGYWSTYWYNGRIYGTEIARGLDVFALTPSEHLTSNEIAAAELATQGPVFNPQQQLRFTWPDEPVVARAYIDQLMRTESLAEALLAQLQKALSDAESVSVSGGRSPAVAEVLRSLVFDLDINTDDEASLRRLAALRETLEGIANRLAEDAVAGLNAL